MATAEEIRRAREETSIFAPLFEYARSNRSQLAEEGRRPVLGGLLSKEPVMGTDTLRYEGVGSLLATLLDPIARGVDAPRAAAQGLIPQEDMIGEAFGTAGTAMLGGGAVAKPAGALGAFYGREGGSIQDALELAQSGRGIFHSSQADQFDEINRYGVEPQYGPWVTEIAEGATDDPSFLDDMPMAAWWSEQPDWVKVKTARAAGKNVKDVTVDDIRKYGHLSIADANEYADTVYRIPEEGIEYEGSEVSNLSGERMPLYATDLYKYGDDGVGRYPFGIERNELVTRESVEPKYSLTGQELVDFLEQYDGDTVSANTMRVYHGGPKKLSASEVEMRPDPEGTPIGFSVTDNPDVAEYYRKMRGGGSISEFDIDLDKANIISESELYRFIDDLENKLDADASYEQIQKGLLDAGIDAIEYPDPEFGIRVVNPNILGANASKPIGLLVLEQQARGNKQLGGLLQSQGMDINDLSTADPREIQGLLDIAARRGILDKRSAAGLKKGLLE